MTPAVRATTLALLVVVPAAFAPLATDAFEPAKVALLASGACLLLALGLAALWERPRDASGFDFATAWRADPAGAAVLVFLLSAAISTALAARPALGVYGYGPQPAGLVTAFATASVYFASRRLAADPGWLDRIAGAAGVAAVLAAVYAYLQWADLDPVGWEWTATFGGQRRVPGTLGHPNHLGTFLAMALPLLAHRARTAGRPAARAAWTAAAFGCLPALALTLSRGAWVATAAALVVFGALSLRRRGDGPEPRRPRRARAAGFALAAAVVFLLPLVTPLGAGLRARLRETLDPAAPTTRSRALLWRSAVAMAAERPLTGVGTDGFAAAFPRFRTPASWHIEWSPGATKAHSEPFQALATQGWPGLVATLLVVLLAGRAVRRAGGRSGDRAAAAAAGASLAAFAVSGLASFTVAATGALAAALAGWAAGRARAPDEARPPERTTAGAVALAVGLVAAAALWIPFVLTPWRATLAASEGLAAPPGSRERVEGLARAVRIAPWDGARASALALAAFERVDRAEDPARGLARLEDARRALERAVQISPGSVDDRALLAHVLARRAAATGGARDRALAREAAAGALALDPAGARTLVLVAQGYRRMGETGEARVLLSRCASLYPDFALPVMELGVLALEEGRAADAADTLARALTLNWHDLPAAEPVARARLEEARARLAAAGIPPRAR